MKLLIFLMTYLKIKMKILNYSFSSKLWKSIKYPNGKINAKLEDSFQFQWNRKNENKMFSMTYLNMIMIESYKIGRFWNIHFPSVMKITEIEKRKIKCFQWHTWRWSWLNLTKVLLLDPSLKLGLYSEFLCLQCDLFITHNSQIHNPQNSQKLQKVFQFLNVVLF